MVNILRAELLKLKKSGILLVVIGLPLFTIMQGVGNFLRYYDLFTEQGQDIWQQIYIQSSIFYMVTLLPIIITLVMALLVRIENKESSLKLYLSLPLKKADIYFSKLLIGIGLIFLNLLIFTLGILGSGLLLAKTPLPLTLLIKPLLVFIATLPIIAIQYYLSMRYEHVAIPIGIGILFSLPAILIMNTRFWLLFPWTYSGMVGLGGSYNFNEGFLIYILSIVIFLVVTGWGIVDFNKKDII